MILEPPNWAFVVNMVRDTYYLPKQSCMFKNKSNFLF